MTQKVLPVDPNLISIKKVKKIIRGSFSCNTGSSKVITIEQRYQLDKKQTKYQT